HAADFVHRGLAQRPRLVLANSRAAVRWAHQLGVSEQRIQYFPNGIDEQRFSPKWDDEVLKLRRSWGISDDDFLIGMVARLDPIKDHRALLKAAVQLRQRRFNVKFVCIGDGPKSYSEVLHALLVELDLQRQIRFVDSCPSMPTAYNSLN